MSEKKRRHFLRWFERRMQNSWIRFNLKGKYFKLAFLGFDYLRHKYDIFIQYIPEKGYSDKWNKEI